MKKNVSLFFFFLMLVVANKITAQMLTVHPYQLLITFNAGTPTSSINDLKTALNATELAISMPSETRLWQISTPYPFTLPPSAGGATINNLNDAVGHVHGKPETKGVSENYIVLGKPNGSAGGSISSETNISIPNPPTNAASYSLVNDASGTSCGGATVSTLYCPTAGNIVKIAILDTGIGQIAGTSGTFFGSSLKYPQSRVFTESNGSFLPTAIAYDDNNHGTAVAGILRHYEVLNGATFELFPIKILNNSGEGYAFNLIQGIDYAITINIDIANLSLIGTSNFLLSKPSPLEIAIDVAKNTTNMLVVAAAGNDNLDISPMLYPPASLPNSNIMVAGSIDCNNAKSNFSNYSPINVDVMTPGRYIRSINKDGMLILCEGTSFAAPIATGMASLLRSTLPTMNWSTLKTALVCSVDVYAGLAPYCLSSGVLNATAAYNAIGATSCSVVLPLELTDFKATMHQNKIRIEWTTVKEQNIARFVLEKSKNGLFYQPLQTFDSPKNNATDKNSYQVIDQNPFVGTTYYRLRVIEKDGIQSLERVASVQSKGAEIKTTVYPNPFNEALYIDVHSEETITDFPMLWLYDITGSQVVAPYSFDANTKQFQLHSEQLPTGIFYLKLKINDAFFDQKVVLIK
jgi:hypothetical protein